MDVWVQAHIVLLFLTGVIPNSIQSRLHVKQNKNLGFTIQNIICKYLIASTFIFSLKVDQTNM